MKANSPVSGDGDGTFEISLKTFRRLPEFATVMVRKCMRRYFLQGTAPYLFDQAGGEM